jgi:NAD+ kinase
MPSASAVRRAAVITHGKPETIGDALERLERLAGRMGVELTEDEDTADVDLAVVLGGDGTMLRALKRFLGTPVSVLGVNFGRVGFLATVQGEELEAGLERVFAGAYEVVELPTLEAEAGGSRATAVNDVVATSAKLGRMIELDWAVGGEDLGVLPCDGVIASTPPGSTAYNLSNGGPVLVWGLDAMAVTFIAPHSLHARPLVVPRSADLVLENRTVDVGVTVLADGRTIAELGPGGRAVVRLGSERTRLARLPETTFFRRYRDTFAA